MDRGQIIELLSGMIAIPSVSRDEKLVADYLESAMLKMGLQVNRKENNLWLSTDIDSSKPTIMLNAHIDTVRPAAGWKHDPFVPSLEGDRLYGLGSNDDGGSVISMLAVFVDLMNESLPYNLMFSTTAEEEVCGKNGVECILDEVGKIDLWVIGEPTQMQMAVAEKGLMVLDCTAQGVGGHAARNEGVNAIYEALQDIEWFRTYQFPRVSEFLGPVKMTVTQIEAGTQHNVIPAECKFVVDIRGNGLYSNVEMLEYIKQTVKCTVKERSTRLNSSSISLNHPFVQTGLAIGLKPFGSPTASNQTVLTGNTIKIGPGDSSRSHTADEYICISEIEEGIKIYKEILKNIKL